MHLTVCFYHVTYAFQSESTLTNFGNFDLSLLNIDQIALINNLDAYIEKTGENKCLIFASTDKNEMMLGDYTEIWDEIKEQIELISGSKVNIANIL